MEMKTKEQGTVVFLFLFLIILFPSASFSEPIGLTLRDAVEMALRENLSLKAERYSIAISESEVLGSMGEFDPGLSLEVSNAYQKRSTASSLSGSENKQFIYDISLAGKVNTGTAYELKWSNERVKSNLSYLTLNPYNSSELTLTVTQPLLKGFGKDVQESALNVARNGLIASRLGNDENAISAVSDTAKAYWELYYAKRNLEVAELSLKLAENLLNEVRAKIEAGAMAPVEIYNPEAEVAVRQENLIRARKAVSDGEDALRAVINLNEWEKEIVPTNTPPVPSEVQTIQTAMEDAFNNRRDYGIALIEKKSKEIMRRFYDNQKYPEVDAFASAGLNGLDGSYPDALERLGSGNYYSWQVGLAFTVPIGNRAARGSYMKAKYEDEKAGADLEVMRQKIEVEVREAWRALRAAAETVASSGKVRIAAEKRLRAEEERFRVGMAILNDVLRFQEEYAKALSSEKRAAVDYAIAKVELEKVKGTLIEQSALQTIYR
jgi:outer membrane protein TolC